MYVNSTLSLMTSAIRPDDSKLIRKKHACLFTNDSTCMFSNAQPEDFCLHSG